MIRFPWYCRLMAHLAGLLMGSGLLIACSKGVVVDRWYEPRRAVTYSTTYARMGAAPRMRLSPMVTEYDDEDFCIALQRTYRRKNLRLIDTLYLPYTEWQRTLVGDTVRMRTKIYSDWRIE